MKKRLSVLTSMLLTLVLMVSMMPAAMAVEKGTVNPTVDTGEITVTLKYGENPVSGIDVALYRVAEGRVENNNLYFDLLPEFKPAEGPVPELDGLNAEQTAEVTGKLAEKISKMTADEKEDLRYAKATTDENGEAKFQDKVPDKVPVGVYLVVQSSDSSYRFSPVLLYLPYTFRDDTGAGLYWEFAVAVNPKVSYHGGGGGGTPEPPVDPDDPNPPIIIPDEDPPLAELPSEDPELEDILDEEPPLAILPQTGLLQWPIPVMAAAGLLLIGLGLLSEKRKVQNY